MSTEIGTVFQIMKVETLAAYGSSDNATLLDRAVNKAKQAGAVLVGTTPWVQEHGVFDTGTGLLNLDTNHLVVLHWAMQRAES